MHVGGSGKVPRQSPLWQQHACTHLSPARWGNGHQCGQ